MNPDTLYGGYAAERTYDLPQYSADKGWSLSARIVQSATTVAISSDNAVGAGAGWTLLIPATSLADLATGKITLQLIATSSAGDACIAFSERLNFFATTATDLRTTLEIQLEAIDAVLENKATQDQSSVSYNGRSISRFSHKELQDARDRIANQIQRIKDRAAGKGRIKSNRPWRFPN